MSEFREYICSESSGWDFGEDGKPRFKLWRGDKEVIRCRDCKGSEDGPWHKCETFVAHGEDANGFCAWAERRGQPRVRFSDLYGILKREEDV